MKKKKVHYADIFACDAVCHLLLFVSNKRVPKTTFNKRRVTCKNCRKTKVFKKEGK